MTCQETRRHLDDYLDGVLAGRRRRSLARHLDGCESCRRELAGHRRLLDEARAMRSGLAPDHDLWRGIEARLTARPLSSAAGPWRRWLDRLVPTEAVLGWAAAGAALVAGLVLAVTLERGPTRPPYVAASRPAGGLTTDAGRRQAAAAEAPMIQVRRDLAATLEDPGIALDPATVHEVERNLAILDAASAEIRAALEEQPGSIHLNRLLASQYQREAEVLKQLHRL